MRQDAGGRSPSRATPARAEIRLLALRALGSGNAEALRKIAAGVAASSAGADAEANGTSLTGTRLKKWGVQTEMAVNDLCRAGLARYARPDRVQITGRGEALLKEAGGHASGGDHAAGQARGRQEPDSPAERGISDALLCRLSPEYRQWRENARVGARPRRNPGKSPSVSSGIVAAIDMLGAANERTECEDIKVHKRWARLVNLARSLFRPKDGFEVRAESDTIKVVGGGYGAETLLKSFGLSSWRIIVEGIKVDVPVRGCVAAGRYCTGNEYLVTGEAVREAKEWHEAADWIGVVAAPSAGTELDKMKDADRGGPDSVHEYYAKYRVPFKAGLVDAWAVNWPRQCNVVYGDDGLEKIAQIVAGNLKKPLGLSAGRKWRNTKKFYEEYRRAWDPYRLESGTG